MCLNLPQWPYDFIFKCMLCPLLQLSAHGGQYWDPVHQITCACKGYKEPFGNLRVAGNILLKDLVSSKPEVKSQTLSFISEMSAATDDASSSLSDQF